MLEHERSKATNSITKNATKFKREVSVAEFENGEGESASENEMLRPWSMYLSLRWNWQRKSGKTIAKYFMASSQWF